MASFLLHTASAASEPFAAGLEGHSMLPQEPLNDCRSYLSGNFAPIETTYSSTPCTYSGKIPQELLGGQYVRNGGNPVTNADLGRDAHWFDGDGMLAGVLFQRSPSKPDEMIPHFMNQFILTDLCISAMENPSLVTPILPSISTLVNPASRLLVIIYRIFRTAFLVFLSLLSRSRQSIKRISVANTAIYFHDGRALATCESGPPIRVQLPGLETVGWFDGNRVEGESLQNCKSAAEEPGFGGTGLNSWMREWSTGHPKVDPATGELVLFHCNFTAPYVHYSVVPPQSSQASQLQPKLLNAPVPGCSGGKMMHDFGVSLQHSVILDLPLTLTPYNLLKNQPVVCYEPDKPSRFGVFPRREPGNVQWFETAACCIFHTANTWDEKDTSGNVAAVNMLACRLTSSSVVFSAANLQPPPHPDSAKSISPRPMSFFAKYDEDDTVDPERDYFGEKTPLLTQITTAGSSRPTLPHGPPTPPISHDDAEQCRLYYYRFSLTHKVPTITHQYALSVIPVEFPTLNPAYEMVSARYIYTCSTSDASFGAALGKATKVDVLVKMDVQTLLQRGEAHPPSTVTGCVDNRSLSQVLASQDEKDPVRAYHMPPNWYAQEARFVARDNAQAEDDGFLLFYAFDESQLDEYGECLPDAVSELWILDARNMRDVLARVRLPQRVPYGLHGNWFSEEKIQTQRRVEKYREMPATKARAMSLCGEYRKHYCLTITVRVADPMPTSESPLVV
ncbi:carotenoid oxygenase [Lophiostoma macrostomum CBS 122681]|uniref:Carotenoid oxygenase n=1 Tax=Lophiostoma macrostomum CBS 122681 TaxID=1314788 RepID=A0A6A6SXM4_9PLEO|nr:carotenoid oxygenase [Lophiostoma macrostomum CBS 122681]